MLSRERVLTAVARQEPDRVPMYCWLFWLEQFPEIERRFGTVRDFYERLHLDLVQSFPTQPLLPERNINDHIVAPGDEARPDARSPEDPAPEHLYSMAEALETPFCDPDDADLYAEIRDDVHYHKGRKGRAVFVQTPGVFESATGILGFQQVLEAIIADPQPLRDLFEKIGRWSARYVDNALDAGADVIHISDDWGTSHGLLASPEFLATQVAPAERLITERARRRGAPLSLHSDGCIWKAMELVLDLGFTVLHPVHKSAGMSAGAFKTRYGDRLCMYGGLDVRATLGIRPAAAVRAEIAETMAHAKAGGGLVFCTSHTPGPECSVDDLIAAYEYAREIGGY